MPTPQAALTPKRASAPGETWGREGRASRHRMAAGPSHNVSYAKATSSLQVPSLGAPQPHAGEQHPCDRYEPLQRQHPLPGTATGHREWLRPQPDRG